MQKTITTVYQIEECKKLILKGDVYSLRMAFVLLDNAVEIMMYRSLSSDLFYNEMWLQQDEQMKEQLKPADYKNFKKRVKLNIINRKRVRLINRFFNEKTRYLSEQKSKLKKTEASALRSLHKYRNEIYHKDNVRIETISASTIILFEIVCNLLPRLVPGSTSYSSRESNREDRRIFFEKYKNAKAENNILMLKNTGLKIIKNTLKKGISLKCVELRKVLQQTLQDRIHNSLENLDFVRKDGLDLKTREKALKVIQLIENGKLHGLIDYKKPIKNFTTRFTMKSFSNWKERTKKLYLIEDKVILFKTFTAIENEFEEIEVILGNASMELDGHIQHQIDVMRGK